ncbi:MAG: phosphoribosyl-AMP cyclohydrolase [Coriobacteriaceae bacterium]
MDERRVAGAHAGARRNRVLSRGCELWHKGATSGNTQKLVDLRYDCDADTLLALVHPAGPACHTGERTCFYRSMLEE